MNSNPSAFNINNISLSKWIDFNNKIEHLESEIKQITEIKYNKKKEEILLFGIFVKKAKIAYDSFIEVKEKEKHYEKIVDWYLSFNKSIEDKIYSFQQGGEERLNHLFNTIGLPSYKMNAANKIVFGQFIDSKIISQGCGKKEWVLLQYICSIYLQEKKYDNFCTDEESEKFLQSGELSFEKFYLVRLWWEKFNNFINVNFTVFQDDGESSSDSENMKEHMQRWGWVNFLKNIAKSKIFDIPNNGMNSIDCVRVTNCNEVLVYASEEKDCNLASYRDTKAMYER